DRVDPVGGQAALGGAEPAPRWYPPGVRARGAGAARARFVQDPPLDQQPPQDRRDPRLWAGSRGERAPGFDDAAPARPIGNSMTSPTSFPSLRSFEGSLVPPGDARFAIVAGRFNAFIVERLVEGALDALRRHGVGDDRITVVRVPGSWELPLVCQRLAKSGQFAALVAVSAVIRGATSHYEHEIGRASKGVATVSMATGVPIGFGVLTTDS